MKKTILTVKKDLYINFTTIGIVSSIIIGLIIIGICGIYTDGEGRTFNCISIFSTYNKSALDEDGVKWFRSFMLEQKKKNKLIIISSHIREDIELLCDEVISLEHGRVVGHKSY